MLFCKLMDYANTSGNEATMQQAWLAKVPNYKVCIFKAFNNKSGTHKVCIYWVLNSNFVLKKFSITKFLFTKFVITKFVITKFHITKFVFTKCPLTKFAKILIMTFVNTKVLIINYYDCNYKTSNYKGCKCWICNPAPPEGIHIIFDSFTADESLSGMLTDWENNSILAEG